MRQSSNLRQNPNDFLTKQTLNDQSSSPFSSAAIETVAQVTGLQLEKKFGYSGLSILYHLRKLK